MYRSTTRLEIDTDVVLRFDIDLVGMTMTAAYSAVTLTSHRVQDVSVKGFAAERVEYGGC